MGKKRRTKDIEKRQRLIDIEIDEISLVDKPAIGEKFYITKSINGKGKTVGKKVKKLTVKKTLELADKWKLVAKQVNDKTEACLITGVTKEESQLGFIDGISFEAAIKCDIIDDILNRKFNFEKFKEENPDVFAKADDEDEDGKKKTDDDSEDDEDDEDDSDDDSEDDEDDEDDSDDDSEDDSDDEDTTKSDDDTTDEDNQGDDTDDNSEDTTKTDDETTNTEDDSDDEDTTKADDDSDDNSEDDDGDEDTTKSDDTEDDSDDEDLEKRVVKLEKNIGEVKEMLTSSLDFHEQAAMMTSEAIALVMGALDGVMMLMESDENMSASLDEDTVKSMKKDMSKLRKNIQKAGAKISASRLQVLRDIAEKLFKLIESVSNSEKACSGKGGKKSKTQKSVIESLETKLESVKKSLTKTEESLEKFGTVEKSLKDIAKRLDDVESSLGGASDVGDDDIDDDDDDVEDPNQESVFKGFGPLSDVSERIQKQARVKSKS